MQIIKNKTKSAEVNAIAQHAFFSKMQNFISANRLRMFPSDLADLCHYFLHDLFIDFHCYCRFKTINQVYTTISCGKDISEKINS